jgi:hypothetical protein
VPDAALFGAIADLEGVTGATVEFDNTFGYSARYRGDVQVTEDADAMCVLYQTVGLLKQGRASVLLDGIDVVQGERRLDRGDLTAGAEAQQDRALPPVARDPVVLECEDVALEPFTPDTTPMPTS